MVLDIGVPKEGLVQFGEQDSEAAQSRKSPRIWKENKECVDEKEKGRTSETSEGPIEERRGERMDTLVRIKRSSG